jgi:hypothetical protein
MGLVVRPEDYKDEILKLYTQEKPLSQAEIMRLFQEKHGLELKRSTLSDFLKPYTRNGTAEVLRSEAQPGALAPAMPEAGVEVSEQFTALADFYKANADELIEKLSMVMEGVQQLHQEGNSRHEALQSKLDTVLARLRGEVPSSVLRRIFGRGVLAGMLLVGVPGIVVLVSKPLTVLWVTGWVRNSVVWAWGFVSRLFT